MALVVTSVQPATTAPPEQTDSYPVSMERTPTTPVSVLPASISSYPLAVSSKLDSLLTAGAEVCDVCPAGYYCTERDKALPCLRGHYCPEGTGDDLVNCPLGTFANTTGLAQEDECSQCSGTDTSPLPHRHWGVGTVVQ